MRRYAMAGGRLEEAVGHRTPHLRTVLRRHVLEMALHPRTRRRVEFEHRERLLRRTADDVLVRVDLRSRIHTTLWTAASLAGRSAADRSRTRVARMPLLPAVGHGRDVWTV